MAAYCEMNDRRNICLLVGVLDIEVNDDTNIVAATFKILYNEKDTIFFYLRSFADILTRLYLSWTIFGQKYWFFEVFEKISFKTICKFVICNSGVESLV